MVQVCYLRLLLGLKLFPVAYYNGWQGWTWIMKLKKTLCTSFQFLILCLQIHQKENYYC